MVKMTGTQFMQVEKSRRPLVVGTHWWHRCSAHFPALPPVRRPRFSRCRLGKGHQGDHVAKTVWWATGTISFTGLLGGTGETEPLVMWGVLEG